MKIKPTSKAGGIVLELGPKEKQIPAPEQNPIPLFKLKRILVPVDFSTCSNKALQYALPFARQFKADVVLLHVVVPHPAVPELGPVDMEAMSDGRAELDTLTEKVRARNRCTALLRVGDPAREIVEAARESGADLIILSTHGRTGLAHVLLGSTAERVVRHARCPVLVVREREQEFIAPELEAPAEQMSL